MSDQAEARNSAAGQPDDPVINPASIETINRMGLWYLIFTALFFYLLLATWPVLEPDKKAFKAINLFGFWCSWAPDRQMIFTVMMAGAIGSLAHTLTSFSDYVGNRQLSNNWIWFLVLRIPIGIAMAVFFYFVIRGGLLIPTIQVDPQAAAHLNEATLQVNPYSIAAFSALAGMFSKQATDKLGAVFDTVFAMKNPVPREGTLGSGQPVLQIVPSTLTKGKREDLTVTGSGFQKDTKATINARERPFTPVSETQGTVKLDPEDVAKTGRLELVITNPNKNTFKGTVEVVEPAADKPVISGTDPTQLSKTDTSLSITGQGFQTGCTTTVNGKERKPTTADDKKITIPLDPGDVANPGNLKLVVTNPDGGSVETTIKVV